MNLQKLREAESLFLLRYPGGFENEEMQKIGKKHNVGKLAEFAATALTMRNFGNQAKVLEDISRWARATGPGPAARAHRLICSRMVRMTSGT